MAATAHGTVDLLASSLSRDGYVVIDSLFDQKTLAAARDEALHLHASGKFHAAGTGRGQRPQVSDIRGDSILWLDDAVCGTAARHMLDRIEQLRVELNRRLYLGLNSVEAHYALYPPGGHYRRHRDRFRDSDARVISLVTYLNSHWPADGGGELRLHLADATLDISPEIGTSVLFLSADIEHEVLPAKIPRLSIAGWFRRDGGAGY